MVAEARFDCYVLALAGLDSARLIVAAERAGALGIVPVTRAEGLTFVLSQLQAAPGLTRFGLSLDRAADLALLVKTLPAGLATVMASPAVLSDAATAAAKLRKAGVRLLCEVVGGGDAVLALAGRVDGFVLKGHECGGLVSEQTSFVLLQEFRRLTDLPLILRGGITPETAAAALVGGASGAVLDDQIVLLAESPLTDAAQRRRIAGFSGGETLQVEAPRGGLYLRGLDQPGSKLADLLAARLRAEPVAIHDIAASFSWAPGYVAPAGQGLALARAFATRYRSLGRLIGAIQRAVETLPAAAAARSVLAEGGPLARAMGIRYPIFQGPMTRVSDVSEFFLRVAEAGALPFAALALLNGDSTEKLLTQTRDLLGDRPWGVGVLGFADTKILKPQIDAIDKVKPDYAIVAGGRINQILDFEAKGIPAFAHSSTAGLLTHYLDEGVRRFIIEGRECGGHVGPLSSFMLWGSIVEALRDHPVVAREGKKISVVFAGGIMMLVRRRWRPRLASLWRLWASTSAC